MSEEVEKKKERSKKVIMISIISVVVVIAVAAIGGYFAYQYLEESKPIEQEWADTYYNYIKGSEEESTEQDSRIQNNSKIGFIEIEEIENPVMLVEYEKEEKVVTDIYFIQEGTVKNVIDLGIESVELLYDISAKKYDWYTHTATDTNDTYKKVSTQILTGNKTQETEETEQNTQTKTEEYVFTKNEEVSVDTVDGNKIAIPKFDTVFVKTDATVGKVDYREEMSNQELKKAMIEGVHQYKTGDEMITDEIKNNVTAKETEIVAKQEEMKKAQEEVKKVEEEKRKAEEMKITQSNVLSKIGDHLKYFSGCYLGSTYGIGNMYKLVDVTGKINVPGINSSYEMTYEVVGLSSISALNAGFEKCMAQDVISRLKGGPDGDVTKHLHNYNGKVYWGMGGIGAGSSMDYKKAKVISSDGDTTVVRVQEHHDLADQVIANIDLTVKYDEATSSFKITNYTKKDIM